MKKIGILLFLLCGSCMMWAQKVYSVDYDYQAGKNDGNWFFTDYSYQADKKIYFTKYDYQADIKIYFVDYDYQAGWRENSKQHFMW